MDAPETKGAEPEHSGSSAAPEGPRDWHAEYLREVGQSRKYRQRAQKAEAELTELRPQALSAEQYEEYQRLRQASQQWAKADGRVKALEAMLREVVGANELSKALVACGVGRSGDGACALVHAAKLLSDRIDVDLSGEQPVARVLDESGQPLLRGGDEEDSPGEPIPLQEFVARWLAEEGSHFLPASCDTGSGVWKGDPAGSVVSIRDLDRDPKRKAQFIARHGPQAFVQLARGRRQ